MDSMMTTSDNVYMTSKMHLLIKILNVETIILQKQFYASPDSSDGT